MAQEVGTSATQRGTAELFASHRLRSATQSATAGQASVYGSITEVREDICTETGRSAVIKRYQLSGQFAFICRFSSQEAGRLAEQEVVAS